MSTVVFYCCGVFRAVSGPDMPRLSVPVNSMSAKHRRHNRHRHHRVVSTSCRDDISTPTETITLQTIEYQTVAVLLLNK